MTNNRRISIHFCGGCNPRIDRGQVAAQVVTILKSKDYQVCYNSLDVDFVIYLSGCTANCSVKNKKSNHPSVVVAANTLDAMTINEEQLVTEIVMKVGAYFESMERKVST
ncbi:hypothetical protein [Pelosinus sp. sgz500959]|uniref:hypothetical protein n=1 Tax=Pelosinus sp. sgz500959 TaxID=3242472 RepID=UPI003672FBD7